MLRPRARSSAGSAQTLHEWITHGALHYIDSVLVIELLLLSNMFRGGCALHTADPTTKHTRHTRISVWGCVLRTSAGLVDGDTVDGGMDGAS